MQSPEPPISHKIELSFALFLIVMIGIIMFFAGHTFATYSQSTAVLNPSAVTVTQTIYNKGAPLNVQAPAFVVSAGPLEKLWSNLSAQDLGKVTLQNGSIQANLISASIELERSSAWTNFSNGTSFYVSETLYAKVTMSGQFRGATGNLSGIESFVYVQVPDPANRYLMTERFSGFLNNRSVNVFSQYRVSATNDLLIAELIGAITQQTVGTVTNLPVPAR